jgi:hypothetical protein
MPTPTYKPLATVTLGSSAASVTFSSIPATYRDLVLVVAGTTTGSAGLRMRLNNDSGTNYSYVNMYGVASAGSETASSQNILFPGVVTLSSGQRFTYTAQVMDYYATDKHKTVLYRANENNAAAVSANASRWASTSAVTSIQLSLSANSYDTGTTVNLYGIVS